MRVHQFACGFWDLEPPSLSDGFKRLRPLAAKLQNKTDTTISAFELKNYIRPDCGPRSNSSSSFSSDDKRDSHRVEMHPGGTRWNPTQEQIGILEMLYRGGMRTPNAQEIEQITKQLGNYGKIEGKNVFYWFQNHKARERQKQKRNSLGLCHSPRTLAADSTIGVDHKRDEDMSFKRKCRSWVFECLEEEFINVSNAEDIGDRTLELFPLHPEVTVKHLFDREKLLNLSFQDKNQKVGTLQSTPQLLPVTLIFFGF